MDEELKNFYCEKCKKPLDTVLVSGYDFGDRILEGVMFIVANNNGTPKVIGVTEECESYFAKLNKKYWYEACFEHCKSLDIASCPDCMDDIGVWDCL